MKAKCDLCENDDGLPFGAGFRLCVEHTNEFYATPDVSAAEFVARKRSEATAAAPNAGVKHDSGKLPLHLLPFDALEQVARVLQFGAKKYGERNWEKGIPHSRTLGAALRHVFAYLRGESTDPETGLSPLAHAVCELLFALAFDIRGRSDLDDRPVK